MRCEHMACIEQPINESLHLRYCSQAQPIPSPFICYEYKATLALSSENDGKLTWKRILRVQNCIFC